MTDNQNNVSAATSATSATTKTSGDRKVPELKLSDYTSGNADSRSAFISSLFEGLKDYGFIILTDHNIESQSMEAAYRVMGDFFRLPEDTKNRYKCPEGGGQRGYTSFGTEHAKDSDYPDLKEFWHVGREVADSHKFAKYYPKNIWPAEIDGFQDVMGGLYAKLDEAAIFILEALGEALKTEPGYFKEMVEIGNSILRPIYYPPVGEAPPAGSVRAAAHEDINLITILMGATSSGLELLDRDGSWLPVETKEGQLIVDTGDMMTVLTNGVLPATTHRVVNPPDAGSERFSMPFFVHPHPDTMLATIESCRGAEIKYPAINSHEFLLQRLKEIGLT